MNYYALTGKRPDYDYSRPFAKQKAKLIEEQKAQSMLNARKIEEPVIISRAELNKTITMTVTIDDISIKVENVEADYLVSIIKSLTK